MATNKLIYQFRIDLLQIEPSIWRRIQVSTQLSRSHFIEPRDESLLDGSLTVGADV